jgi:hypothetical protein
MTVTTSVVLRFAGTLSVRDDLGHKERRRRGRRDEPKGPVMSDLMQNCDECCARTVLDAAAQAARKCGGVVNVCAIRGWPQGDLEERLSANGPRFPRVRCGRERNMK